MDYTYTYYISMIKLLRKYALHDVVMWIESYMIESYMYDSIHITTSFTQLTRWLIIWVRTFCVSASTRN